MGIQLMIWYWYLLSGISFTLIKLVGVFSFNRVRSFLGILVGFPLTKILRTFLHLFLSDVAIALEIEKGERYLKKEKLKSCRVYLILGSTLTSSISTKPMLLNILVRYTLSLFFKRKPKKRDKRQNENRVMKNVTSLAVSSVMEATQTEESQKLKRTTPTYQRSIIKLLCERMLM